MVRRRWSEPQARGRLRCRVVLGRWFVRTWCGVFVRRGAPKPEKYEDTYRDALCDVIKAKRKGQEIHRAAAVEEEEPADLMSALRASIERSKGGRGARRSKASRGNGNGRATGRSRSDLGTLSKADLDKRARAAGIEGRSKMSKEELIDALRAA
jgi:DNA end-binding protein Ku